MQIEDIHIIDAHAHLWLRQEALVEGRRIEGKADGRAMFMGEERQMMPPFITDGRNTAEIFLSNMNYAQVSAAVITQEFIDGVQNDYLREVQGKYPDRFRCCGFCDFRKEGWLDEAMRLMDEGVFPAIALPAHRLNNDPDGRAPLNGDDMMTLFKEMERRGIILSLCLDNDERQIARMDEAITECPHLKVAVGHFGMATTEHWMKQVLLARHPNVFIESGGITWLYNDEFYPFPGAVRAIREAADAVGMDKLMWGSDYPRTITAITYRMSYDFVLRSTELSDAEKRAFLSGNARAFYGFSDLCTLPYVKNMSE